MVSIGAEQVGVGWDSKIEGWEEVLEKRNKHT
jgi:hypothetical protein